MRGRVANAGAHPTPVIDRFWFKSVYFKEPGGVLFELATDGPGFAVDEIGAPLGESLVLPPWLEAQRGQIQAILPTLAYPPALPKREDGARLMLVRLATRAGRALLTGGARAQRVDVDDHRARADAATPKPATAPASAPSPTTPGTPMTATAKGPFDVKLTPQGTATDPTAVGRMSLDKTFHGDLAGTSVGEMLAVRTAVSGSAGYVAIERVTGTLAGRTGTFALQHWGMMDKGAPDLKISVIPDSGDRRPGRSRRHHDDRHPAGRQALLRLHLHAAAGREMIARRLAGTSPSRWPLRDGRGVRRRADRVRPGRATADAEAADAREAGGDHRDSTPPRPRSGGRQSPRASIPTSTSRA